MIKFVFIGICFAVVLGSYFFRRSTRDWGWLAGGMAFTLGADYFLVLHDNHVPGIAVFCFVHVCYGLRAYHSGKEQTDWKRVIFIFALVGAIILLLVWLESVLLLGGLYAALFATNLRVNTNYRKALHNAPLVLTGLHLFMLCDICVLLFNIPRYFGILPALDAVFPFIWIFYLPAQVLLAFSAVNYKKILKTEEQTNHV